VSNENNNPYESPASNVEEEMPKVRRDEAKGRRAYVFQLFMIWIILPLIASFIARYFGIDDGGVNKTAKFNMSNEIVGTGFKLDIFYVWYLQVPIYIYYTRDRVSDTGLNLWFTLLFILPVINFALWFWPPKHKFQY